MAADSLLPAFVVAENVVYNRGCKEERLMVQVICDVCGKPVKDAHLDTTYVYRLGRDICMPCHQKLLESVDKAMSKKPSFGFEQYWSTYGSTVKQMTK
jgi:hypothetical protein